MAKNKDKSALILGAGLGLVAVAAAISAKTSPGQDLPGPGEEEMPYLKVLDFMPQRVYTLNFPSGVLNDAAGTTYHNAYASNTIPENSLLVSYKHIIGVDATAKFEAEIRISFANTYAASWPILWPGHSIHKHIDNPYVDSFAESLAIPILFKKGQVIYANGIAVNCGAAAANIQFVTLCTMIPLSELSYIKLNEYDPNRSS